MLWKPVYPLITINNGWTVFLQSAQYLSTPLGNKQPGSHEFGVVAHLVLLGTKATFEARMFLFYWNKLFHGNKDLFSAALILRSIPIERSDFEARIQILWSNSLGSMLLKGWGGDIAGAMGQVSMGVGARGVGGLKAKSMLQVQWPYFHSQNVHNDVTWACGIERQDPLH